MSDGGSRLCPLEALPDLNGGGQISGHPRWIKANPQSHAGRLDRGGAPGSRRCSSRRVGWQEGKELSAPSPSGRPESARAGAGTRGTRATPAPRTETGCGLQRATVLPDDDRMVGGRGQRRAELDERPVRRNEDRRVRRAHHHHPLDPERVSDQRLVERRHLLRVDVRHVLALLVVVDEAASSPRTRPCSEDLGAAGTRWLGELLLVVVVERPALLELARHRGGDPLELAERPLDVARRGTVVGQ